MKYEYDSSGIYFYYFILSLLGLYLFPTTYNYIERILFPHKFTEGPTTLCQCPESQKKEKLKRERRKRTLRHPRIKKRFVAWTLGWIFFCVLGYQVWYMEEQESAAFYDPFAILGVSSDAAEDIIRKTYKKLSLKWHPDKNQGENKEEAEAKYIEISKAYQTLTDPETHQNWLEYGNPDGKQSFSFGIALPAWIIEPSNSIPVLGVYALMFGFLLPYFVGQWWGKSKKYTKDGVLNYTMGIYFNEMKEGLGIKKMLELLCASMEFKEEVPDRGQQDIDAVMKLFRTVKDVIYTKTGEKLELPHKYNAPYCYKVFTILHAHLFRVPIEDLNLLEDSYIIIPKLVHLTMRGLLQLTSARFWLQQSLNCVEISRMLIQAVPTAWNHMESSELMQLPYFSAPLIKHVRNRKKPIKTVSQFMALAPPERIEMLKAGGLDLFQIVDVLHVGREYPIVTIEKAYFECAGEKSITPESYIAFVLKLKAVKYADEAENAPASPLASKKSSNSDLQTSPSSTATSPMFTMDDDGEMTDDDELGSGKKTSRLTKLLTGAYWKNPNLPVYCPYYPEYAPNVKAKRPNYLMWLANPRNNRVVGSPTTINNLVAKSYTDGAEGGTRTVKFRFQAPPQAGTFVFTVVVACDAYIGIELRQEVKLVVVDLPKDDEEQRMKVVKDAWKDLEEEERIEREMGLSAPFSMNAGARPAVANDDSSSESDESSDED